VVRTTSCALTSSYLLPIHYLTYRQAPRFRTRYRQLYC